MKIAELSRRARVPIPTIKYYIREGMLSHGERVGRNQARYTQAHLDRLALIATLQQAGLSLAVIKRVLQAMDTMPVAAGDFMAIAVDALAPPRTPHAGAADDQTRAQAEAVLRTVVQERGWDISPGSPAWEAAVQACAGVLSVWPGALTVPVLTRYAAAAEAIAAFELPDTWNPAAPADALTYAVLGTVLFEPVILTLRRLAHVDRVTTLRARRRGGAPQRPG